MKYKCKFLKLKRSFIRTKDFFRYDIPYGIRNLIRWFPIIWNDRNWDQWFIFEMLHKKLSLMEKAIRGGCHLHAEKTANQIKVCVLLLDRLKKDDYFENALKNHDKKWGEADFDWEDLKDGSDLCRLNITYPNVKNDEDKENQSKDFKKASKHSEDLRLQDLDMLFKIMNKHILGWWD